MPVKQKYKFNIDPNDLPSYAFSKGTFFAYYDKIYYSRQLNTNWSKIVPWDKFNVTKAVWSKEDLQRYPYGAVWVKRDNFWEYVGPFIPEPEYRLILVNNDDSPLYLSEISGETLTGLIFY